MSKLFIFAVGGTGARVLRSLTMLLASGVRIPNCDQLVPVLIDPDTQNGDVTRTVALLKRYARIHEALYGDGQKEKTGFFSQPMNTLAHLNTSGGGEELRDSFVYDFGGISQPFRDYLKYNDLSVETQGLVDLLFTQDSLAANLDVGFRGSPNVGSVVLNAVVQSKEMRYLAQSLQDGARFAIIPRYGQPEDIRWFEAEPTYTLHWLNAWEEGDEIILDGYFQEEPMPKSYPDAPDGYERMMAYLAQGLLKPKLHRWRFNLKTGKTAEERLDDRILEFGMINQKYAGRKYRYAYSAVPVPEWFLFSGLVKHDLQTGESQEIAFGPGRFGSETPFVPRINAKDEDDGYLVSFIADLNTDKSECVLIDAKNFEAGPVCRIILPERICAGTHSTWANGSDIGMPENTVLAA